LSILREPFHHGLAKTGHVWGSVPHIHILQKRQRTAVATTDFLCGFEASSWEFGFWRAATATPLAKQKRIVAKVDALMALADTFEQQLDDSRAAAELTAA
jgi:hypothetical protein